MNTCHIITYVQLFVRSNKENASLCHKNTNKDLKIELKIKCCIEKIIF